MHLMITHTLIQNWHPLGSTECEYIILYSRDRICIFDRFIVQFPVINIQPPRKIFLRTNTKPEDQGLLNFSISFLSFNFLTSSSIDWRLYLFYNFKMQSLPIVHRTAFYCSIWSCPKNLPSAKKKNYSGVS